MIWAELATSLAGVGLLGLIFLRLGAITEAVTGLKDRVLSLESWRSTFIEPFS